MALYRVVAGQHTVRTAEHKSVNYKTGDTLESSVDLMKIFPNKFERVYQEPQALRSRSAVQAAAEAGAAAVGPASDEDRVEGLDADAAAPGWAAGPALAGWADVSGEFALAQQATLQVFRKGNRYAVVDPDEGPAAISNEAVLKRDVDAAITAYVEKVNA